MKDTERRENPAQPATPERNTLPLASRIKLALLDEYTSQHENRGYDPYNSRAVDRYADAWRNKHKRA